MNIKGLQNKQLIKYSLIREELKMMETVLEGQEEQRDLCRLSPRAFGPRDVAASRDPWWRAASGAGIPAAHPEIPGTDCNKVNERKPPPTQLRMQKS